jgi:eukaryotic-like serine/threonine-protein kinase
MDLLADSLAVGVLRELGRARPIGAVPSVGFGTRSLPALKEFLQGEQFFRRTAWDSALAHYGRAVALDSTFAVALWRLAWVYREAREVSDPRGHEYLLKAGALNRGLATRESLLVTADSIHGALLLHTSDTAYSVLLRRLFATLDAASAQYPGDPDVWNTVGRARAQFGHVVGLSVAQTLDAYERAIKLDSAFAPSYENAVDLSLKLRDSVAARRYVDAYLARDPGNLATPSMRFVAEFLRPAPSRSQNLARALDTLSTEILDEIWYLISRWPDSAETAVRIAQQSVMLVGAKASDTGAYSPAEWRSWLVRTLAYRGHVKEAYRAFTPFEGFAGSVIYVDLALLRVPPADSAQAEFERWLRDPPGRKTPLPLPWWSAQGDTASLLRLMRRCDSIIQTAPPNAQATRYALHGARVAKAYMALARGDTATALRQLEPLPDGLCPHCVPDVLVRAHLLEAKHRYPEAASILDRGPPTLLQPLPRPAEVLWELERARVHDRLGERKPAIAAYRFVTAVWANADPELQPYVREARAALERLGR